MTTTTNKTTLTLKAAWSAIKAADAGLAAAGGNLWAAVRAAILAGHTVTDLKTVAGDAWSAGTSTMRTYAARAATCHAAGELTPSMGATAAQAKAKELKPAKAKEDKAKDAGSAEPAKVNAETVWIFEGIHPGDIAAECKRADGRVVVTPAGLAAVLRKRTPFIVLNREDRTISEEITETLRFIAARHGFDMVPLKTKPAAPTAPIAPTAPTAPQRTKAERAAAAKADALAAAQADAERRGMAAEAAALEVKRRAPRRQRATA